MRYDPLPKSLRKLRDRLVVSGRSDSFRESVAWHRRGQRAMRAMGWGVGVYILVEIIGNCLLPFEFFRALATVSLNLPITRPLSSELVPVIERANLHTPL